MIYWTDYDDYRIIEDDGLRSLSQKYGVKLVKNDQLDKKTRDWFNYSRIASAKYGLNAVYSACFTYYVTTYFAEDGISAGAEEDYFVKRLDKYVNDLYYQVIRENKLLDDVGQKRVFFESLVDFFAGDSVRGFEKKIFQHNIRVSSEIREWFDGFGSVREGVVGLLYGSVVCPHLNMNVSPVSNVVFLLSYSEEALWRGLSGLDDSDRLRVLLY